MLLLRLLRLLRLLAATWLLLALFLSAATAATPATCPPLPVATGAAAADRGVLWALDKDGRRSWLYGTLHVGKPDWMRPGPRLAAALAESEVLALEIDPADPALPQVLAGAASSTAGPPPLPAPLLARLALATERACLPPGALSGLPPVLQATVLAMLDARWLGLDAMYAQEHLLTAQARNRRLRVVSLETPAQQTAAMGGDTPAQTEALIAQTLDQIDDQRSRGVMSRLATAWASGDLDTLEAFDRWCECAPTEDDRAYLRRLNDARNPRLADGIAAQHASGQRVFAAVGALHMTGPAALPLLLAARGFRVERITLGTPAPAPR
jgi:uncharacterized protein YbaP (TraB family)